jgi:hypothetical protein
MTPDPGYTLLVRNHRFARYRPAALAVLLLVASSALAVAQFRRPEIGGALAPLVVQDRNVAICRLVYTEVRRFAGGWRTDYPLGERNLSVRLGELTRTRVSKRYDGAPNHYLVRLTDPQLFSCPILMAGDVGSMGLTDSDAARLREYLLKGGFLWTDDMWGSEQWNVWTRELAKVFPPDEFPIELVTPTDPIFSTQFEVAEMPQIPNIGFWRGSGGGTSEQGPDSAVPMFHAVRDPHGRIMLAMTHNTDIADAFEREGDDPEYFVRFSPRGYALGINIMLYALTH